MRHERKEGQILHEGQVKQNSQENRRRRRRGRKEGGTMERRKVGRRF